MPFEKGSLILANFTAKIKDTGVGVETTVEEDAKKLGIHDPTRKYESRLVAVGDGWVLQGVDESLLMAEVGQKQTIEVPPEKAFGLKDNSKVRLMPIRRFGEKADQLEVGTEIEMDGRVGIVKLLGSGRVQMDFNHRYAGKTIVYDIEVVKALDIDDDKIKFLVRRRIPIDADKIGLTIEGSTITLKLPNETYLAEGIQIIKRAITTDVFKYIKNSEKVVFLEEYISTRPKEDKPAASTEIKPEEKQVAEVATPS